jgi:17beta-estradiol 17-dehydrogenase / very-long-chain 3-oxoacyl-CoA reductase
VQAPFFVATGMVSRLSETSRLTLLLVAPTPDAYARAAVRWMGHGPPLCAPNLCHQLLWCLAAAVPDPVHDRLRLRANLRHRELFHGASTVRRAGVPTIK